MVPVMPALVSFSSRLVGVLPAVIMVGGLGVLLSVFVVGLPAALLTVLILALEF